MSHYHSGYTEGQDVERGIKPEYNGELLDIASFRNGWHAGRAAVIKDREMAKTLGLVTFDVAGKPHVHLGYEDPLDALPVCGAGADVPAEAVSRSEMQDATCAACLEEARGWAADVAAAKGMEIL